MRLHEIENWALAIIDRLETGQPIEDSRVEVKSKWIDPQKAARRIAGHANSARGAPILWLIGIDEDKGVVGAPSQEVSIWYQQVSAQFDGLPPRLVDINVPVRDQAVCALLFETDRAPFVVKNPVYGQAGAGPVALEVPWREGTSTRSARREDLLRLLSPLQKSPTFEVLDGTLVAQQWKDKDDQLLLDWSLDLALYAVTSVDNLTVIPLHLCHAEFKIPGHIPWTEFTTLSLGPPRTPPWTTGESRSLSLTVQGTPDEVLLHGPGKVHLRAHLRTALIQELGDDGQVAAALQAIDADHPVPIAVSLVRYPPAEENNMTTWAFKRPSPNS